MWISHGYTCVSHPEPLSHLPPHPIPQGHPSAPALSPLSHASNLDWQSVSHLIIYMFQCYSLKSSHPCPLPQNPKTVLYISVSFAVFHHLDNLSFSLRDFLYPWTLECGISSVIWNWLFSDFTTLSFIFTVPVTVITIEFNWLLQTSPVSLVKS